MKFIIFAIVCLSALAVEATDFRNEFDRLLVQTTIEYTTDLNNRILALQIEIDHLTAKPNKAEQEKIIIEMESIISYAQKSELVFVDKLKATDLNMVEKYNYEQALKASQDLIKKVQEAEVKVKAIKIAA